jgi:hypothetical protein
MGRDICWSAVTTRLPLQKHCQLTLLFSACTGQLLSTPQVLVHLHSCFVGALTDRTMAMASVLQQRSGPLLHAGEDMDAFDLGSGFPLLGYRHPVTQLAQVLKGMIAKFIEYCTSAIDISDTYMRRPHLLRLVAAPGSGKTTALTHLWPCLYQACRQLPQLCTPDMQPLRDWVASSLSPQRFLVFMHSLAPGAPSQ